MKVLRWCGKHKIWAFWAVAVVLGVIYNSFGEGTLITGGNLATGDNSIEQGAFLGRALCVYLAVIWAYSGIKKLTRSK